MKDQGLKLRSYLETEWAADGIEIVSSGDTSVTVALSQRLDIGCLVSDLITQYGAECDLMLTPKGATLLISYNNTSEVQSQVGSTNNWIFTIVLAMLYAHTYMYSVPARQFLSNYTVWPFV